MPFAVLGRTAVLAVPAVALLLLLAATATAQTTAPPPTAPPPAPAATAESQPPLMTAPRPDDTPTTDPTASPSGIGGSAPSDEMQRMAPPGTAQGTSPGTAPGTAAAPGRAMTTAEAHALIGKPVQTRDGQTAGEIRDFTLAAPDGRIERLVLASGGFLGVGTKLVSVPVATLRAPSAEAPLTLDLDTGDLAEAPEFDYKQGERTLVGKP